MIRAAYMSGKWMGVEIESAWADSGNIQTLASEGTPVLIVDSMEDFEDFNIDVEMVGDPTSSMLDSLL